MKLRVFWLPYLVSKTKNPQPKYIFFCFLKYLDQDLDWYKYTYEQPLLDKEPSLDDAIAFVRSLVK